MHTWLFSLTQTNLSDSKVQLANVQNSCEMPSACSWQCSANEIGFSAMVVDEAWPTSFYLSPGLFAKKGRISIRDVRKKEDLHSLSHSALRLIGSSRGLQRLDGAATLDDEESVGSRCL